MMNPRAVYALIVVLVLGLLLAVTLDAYGQADPEENQASFWCDNGFKVEWDGDERTFVADADYDLVVIKAGQVNYIFENVSQGDTLEVPKGISHVIFCEGSTPSTSTTVTTEPSTTTTQEDSTTTSTVIDTTTTTVREESSTTSTSTAPTTTSTVPPDGSTTTIPTGSTTLSTQSTVSVPPITITELPFTGMNEIWIAVGIGLLVAGAGALMATRGMPDEQEAEFFYWENR